MLYEADAAIARHDPSLPGLPWLLDDARLEELLRHSAQGAGIVRVQVDYLRYKPATSCLAALRLFDQQNKVQHAFVKALPAGSRDWGWQSRRLTRRSCADGRFSVHLDESLALLFASAEHDRRITALASHFLSSRQQGCQPPVSGPATAMRAPWPLRLPATWPNLAVTAGAAGWGEWTDWQILRYKPERRLVARLQLEQQPTGLLRACSQADFDMTLAGARLAESLGFSRLLASDPAHHCLVSQWVTGESLHPGSGGLELDEHSFRQLGACLHRLHHSRQTHPLRRTQQAELDALNQAADMACLLQPALARQLRALQQQLQKNQPRAGEQTVLIHGDFSLEQVIRRPDGDLCLIDWDSACMGDPASDIGSLLARLTLQVQEGLLPPGTPEMALGNILSSYPAPALRAFCQRVHWHAAAGLLRLMPEGFRKRRPGWSSTMASALEQLVVMVARATAGAGRPGLPPAAGPAELAPLQDTGRMQPILAHALRLPPDGFQLAPVQLLRHRPGRRALLQYQLDFPDRASQRLLGKWRHKGVDQHSYTIQRALWQQGFNMAELSVPEPLAMLPAQQLWLQRHCPGHMYTSLLSPDSPPVLARRIGQAIASLHASRLPVERQWTLADELALLQQRLQQASQLRPVWAARINALAAATSKLAASLPAHPAAGIHRDCYPDQILVDGERLIWLDFDLYCLGDPALDIGNFLAHMIEHAIRHHGDPFALGQQQQALQDSFLMHSPHALTDTAIHGWTTLSLARHIYLSTQFPDRQHTTAPLLALCESRLAIRQAS